MDQEETPAESEGYDYGAWYDKNRDTVLAKRRARYASDPEFAEAQRRRSRDAYQRRAQKRKEERGDQPIDPKKPRKPVQVKIGDRIVEMFSVGTFAQMMQRSTQTIMNWERNGVIPITKFRTTAGARLYSAEMIDAVASTPMRRGESIREVVEAKWRALGMMIDEYELL